MIINNNSGIENNKKPDSTLIIEESNNIKNENENNTDYEGLPILTQLDPIKISLEDYYHTYYPEYKIIKCFNFVFIKMGKLLTFDFDKNNFIPKYSIGPHWYLTIVLLILILFLTILLYTTIMKPLNLLMKIIFFLLIFVQYFFVLKTALTHAKIVMNKKKNPEDKGYCSICKVYFNPGKKVEHCSFCGVCAEKMDHHCIWVGKCVAKNNTFYFYGMIANICILYIYIIICGIFIAVKS